MPVRSVLAVPAAVHDSIQPAAAAYTMSSGRILALVAALAGLIGVVVGGLALARPTGRFGAGNGRRGAVVALAAGLIGMALGALVAATSEGAVGSGNGLGGAIVAMGVGLLAVVVGGLALARGPRSRGEVKG